MLQTANVGLVPTMRPSNSPPPIDGEDEVDLELACLVRGGSLVLEDEDYLIEELVKVYRAFRAHDRKVQWRPDPIPESVGADYGTGYEVLFVVETGQPTAIVASARLDHQEPHYTKRIPAGPFLRRPFLCPLSPHVSNARLYQQMGFPLCEGSGSPNFVRWQEHLDTHENFTQSLKAVNPAMEETALWEKTRNEAATRGTQRTASDPRLHAQQPVEDALEALTPTI